MCLNLKGWILNIAQCLCRLIYLCVSKLVPTFLGELWTCFTKCALSLKGEFWTLKHVNLSGSIRILISDEKLWCSWGDRAASSLKADMWQADSHQKVCLGVGVNGVRYFQFGVGTVGFGTAQTQHILTLGYFTHILAVPFFRTSSVGGEGGGGGSKNRILGNFQAVYLNWYSKLCWSEA